MMACVAVLMSVTVLVQVSPANIATWLKVRQQLQGYNHMMVRMFFFSIRREKETERQRERYGFAWQKFCCFQSDKSWRKRQGVFLIIVVWKWDCKYPLCFFFHFFLCLLCGTFVCQASVPQSVAYRTYHFPPYILILTHWRKKL